MPYSTLMLQEIFRFKCRPGAASGCSDIGGQVSPQFDQLLLTATLTKEHLTGPAAQGLACMLSVRTGMPTLASCCRPSQFHHEHNEALKDNGDKEQASGI